MSHAMSAAAPPRPEPALLIDQLRCEAGGRVTLQVPHLCIEAGERVAIVGANGAGKTTLLRCIGGSLRPAAGRVHVLGRDPARLATAAARQAWRREVGQVLQGLNLVGRLTVRENVLTGLLGHRSGWRTWLRWHSAADIAQADHWLQALGLGAQALARADQLSGGERQKVAIARMLMQRPRLVLADEPTASLDPAAALAACRLLVQATTTPPEAGTALITVVHTPSLLPVLAERVIGLREGRIAFDRPVADVDDALLEALYGRHADTASPTPWAGPAAEGPPAQIPRPGARPAAARAALRTGGSAA
jgi:phosphonate transport system ATP-binding protein